MRSLYVHVSHANARTRNVLRTPILSRANPYESNDGLVPIADDTATIGTCDGSSRRKYRAKQRPNDGTARNNETCESERGLIEPEQC